MKFEVNMNDAAEVVLTELGAQVYNKYHERYTYYRPEIVSKGDVLRDQLWHLMQVFGPAIHLGQYSPFEECRMIFEKGGR
jgi:hypothetical protein